MPPQLSWFIKWNFLGAWDPADCWSSRAVRSLPFTLFVSNVAGLSQYRMVLRVASSWRMQFLNCWIVGALSTGSGCRDSLPPSRSSQFCPTEGLHFTHEAYLSMVKNWNEWITFDEGGSVSCVFGFISSWSSLVPILPSVTHWLPGVKFARFIEFLG